MGMHIGIDLGTANVLVYVKGRGIVLNEPSVVAYSVAENKVVAVGEEARQMLGRTPGSIVVTRPMRDGVIADYMITEAMLRYFIQKVCGKYRLFRPEVMVCIPAGVTNVESRAVQDATLQAGAKVAHLIAEPLAAAIGAGIPIGGPSGNMVVDIGGGTCEAAVISLNDIVVSSSIRVAGNKIDDMIAGFIKKRYNLLIGDRTAEEVKIRIGSALQLKEPMEIEVRGRDQIAGLPKTIAITSDEITEAITDALQAIVLNVRTVLEQTPPELASDVIDKGMVLTGGGALLRHLDKLLSRETGVPAHVADDPMSCVAIGAGQALEHYHIFKRSLAAV
ncbi:MAG TPA: rod shape-determining protein [Chloroflexota bacterium]|nr:rod shape-determining protein [Chloroflexota bacterium]